MIVRWLVSFLLAVAAVMSLLEFTSVAAERRTECRALRSTQDGLFVDVLPTPELPVASELAGTRPPDRPGLTR